MMKKIVKYLSCILLVSCSSVELPIDDQQPDKNLICFRAKINQFYTRRVENNGFSDGDAIGIYVVNYKDGEPGHLLSGGNHVDNLRYTFNASDYRWNPERTVYFNDNVTPVSVYSYYPYRKDIANVNAMNHQVVSNQSQVDGKTGMTGYESSDLLLAHAHGIKPSSGVIDLTHNHLMAGVAVSLVAGNGFTDEEWAQLDKVVMIENTHLDAIVNLEQSNVMVDQSSQPEGVVPAKDGQEWRAIVVPQAVESGKSLISITVAGYPFSLVKDVPMTYQSGKLHKFTIQVENSIPGGDYQFSLIDEAVTVWESDLVSHGGTLNEYIVVNVPEYGRLYDVLQTLDCDLKRIKAIKVTGKLNDYDCCRLREQMPYVEAINMHDVKFYEDKIPEFAFAQLSCLKTFVFPKYVKVIGQFAFIETSLAGDLIIPEGVTHIESSAFKNRGWAGGLGYGQYKEFEWRQISNNLTGRLYLPSTLKRIDDAAFHECLFSGDLILPEGLEYIGSDAFAGCSKLTGRLSLPEGLTEISGGAFDNTRSLSGHLHIPNGIKVIGSYSFRRSGITSVSFPNSLREIKGDSGLGYEGGAFEGSALKGEVVLPDNLSFLGHMTFKNTNISNVIFPDKLQSLEPETFQGCRNLQDTLVIPSGVRYIGRNCFEGCEKLSAVQFPSTLEQIHEEAFRNCFSLGYIRSLASEPPVMDNLSPFYGVAKDNFSIEVPENSVATYRSDLYWGEFKRISSYRGFVSRPSSVKTLNAGSVHTIILNADANWTVDYCPDWCRLSAMDGYKKTELALTIDELPHNRGNRIDNIVFKLDDGRLTYLKVGQYDYHYEEDQYISLQKSSKGTGIDLFIVGDGYDAEDISKGTYLNDMHESIEHFFDIEPYTSYRDYFDVHTAVALSKESGIGTLNTLRNVKFGTTIGDFVNRRITGNSVDVLKYAIETVDGISPENIDRLTAIVIPNTDIYDGVTEMWENGTAVAYCPKSTEEYPYDARGLIQHEAGGHAFGKLGDEYIYHTAFIQTCPCFCCEHVEGITEAQNNGWYRNLSLNGKYKSVEWTHLIFDPRYGDIVDIYEGGYFHSKGVYRSEKNSCMNDNVPYFSTISRQTIVERIMDYSNQSFSFEDFVEKDSREWGGNYSASAPTKSVKSPDIHKGLHGQSPIIHKGSPLK